MIEIADYLPVYQRVSELGCRFPTGIAILPENFDTVASRTEFRYRAEAATIRTLFRINGINCDELLPPGERVPSIHNKSFDWCAVIFVTGALLSENRDAVSVALGVISTYLSDFFKGMPNKNIKLSVIVEKTPTRSCKRVTYEGDVKGLESISDAIKRIADE